MNRLNILTAIAGLTAATLTTTVHAQGERGAWRADPEQIAARLVEKHDADGSGELSVTELAEALTAMRERRGGGQWDKATPRGQERGRPGFGRPASTEELAERWIELFDTDGDGKLDAEELAAAMESRPGPGSGRAARR